MCYQSGSVSYVRFKVLTMVDNERCYRLRRVAMQSEQDVPTPNTKPPS